MTKIVAIDYGKARIGLAISDAKKIIALPLKNALAGKNLEQTAQNILDSLKIYLPEIEKFILGLPLLLSGKRGNMAKEVEKFKEILQTKTEKPIELWDERLTSAQAETSLKELNLSRKKRSKLSDAVAATIILQNYLDSQKN